MVGIHMGGIFAFTFISTVTLSGALGAHMAIGGADMPVAQRALCILGNDLLTIVGRWWASSCARR